MNFIKRFLLIIKTESLFLSRLKKKIWRAYKDDFEGKQPVIGILPTLETTYG